MKAKLRKRVNLYAIDILMKSDDFWACQRILRNIKDSEILCEVALYASNFRVRKYALRKITSDKVLEDFCLNTDSERLYNISKKKIGYNHMSSRKQRKAFVSLARLNMIEMLEDFCEDEIPDTSFFVRKAS